MGFIHLLLGIDIVYLADCMFNLSHFQINIEGLVVGTPREVIDMAQVLVSRPLGS